MKIKIKDQLHISSVSADTLRAGATIEVSDKVGKSLVDRGLATKVAGAPKNKKAREHKNKSA